LTLFVGIVVALNTGLLIGVAYIATSTILNEQIHERLTTVSGDRQEMLRTALKQQEVRARVFAHRSRIHHLLSARARGGITPDRFREEVEPILSNAEANATGLLTLWIEDEAGRMIASGGPEPLVRAYARAERTVLRSDAGLVVPPRRIAETTGAVFAA